MAEAQQLLHHQAKSTQATEIIAALKTTEQQKLVTWYGLAVVAAEAAKKAPVLPAPAATKKQTM